MSLGTEVGLGPGHIMLDGAPAPPLRKKGGAHTPNFRPMSVVATDDGRCDDLILKNALFQFISDIDKKL